MIGATRFLADYVLNAFGLVHKTFMSKCLVYVNNQPSGRLTLKKKIEMFFLTYL